MILKSEKIKAFLSEKKNITIVYIIVIIGVTLLCLPSFFEKEEEPRAESGFISCEITEKEIEDILSEISGVGRCRVLITYKSTEEYVIAKDVTQSTDGEKVNVEEKNLSFGSGSGEKPFVLRENMPQIQGVVVVCQGGDSDKIKMNVTDAVSALTGLAKNRIKVFKR